jgi:hypothetical protein
VIVATLLACSSALAGELGTLTSVARDFMNAAEAHAWLVRCQLESILANRRLPKRNPTGKTLAEHADRKNSIAPVSSLPQLGQVR